MTRQIRIAFSVFSEHSTERSWKQAFILLTCFLYFTTHFHRVSESLLAFLYMLIHSLIRFYLTFPLAFRFAACYYTRIGFDRNSEDEDEFSV